MEDTVKLLKECDAGTKMGVEAIDEVIDKVESESFKKVLSECRKEHTKLLEEIYELLEKYDETGKEPNPIASGMSWMKTNIKMGFEGGDDTAAELIFDGCYMGIKSLSRYLNKYGAASEKSRDIARRLIEGEQELACRMKEFL